MNTIISISIFVLCFTSFALQAKPIIVFSEGMKLRLEQVTAELGIPWGLSFISANQLLVTDRNGPIRRVDIVTGPMCPFTIGLAKFNVEKLAINEIRRIFH